MKETIFTGIRFSAATQGTRMPALATPSYLESNRPRHSQYLPAAETRVYFQQSHDPPKYQT